MSMSLSASAFAADLCRSHIEEMIEAGQSFSAVEDRIASSGLADEDRAGLWQFAWRIWSAQLDDLGAADERPGRFTRLTARSGSARAR